MPGVHAFRDVSVNAFLWAVTTSRGRSRSCSHSLGTMNSKAVTDLTNASLTVQIGNRTLEVSNGQAPKERKNAAHGASRGLSVGMLEQPRRGERDGRTDPIRAPYNARSEKCTYEAITKFAKERARSGGFAFGRAGTSALRQREPDGCLWRASIGCNLNPAYRLQPDSARRSQPKFGTAVAT